MITKNTMQFKSIIKKTAKEYFSSTCNAKLHVRKNFII